MYVYAHPMRPHDACSFANLIIDPPRIFIYNIIVGTLYHYMHIIMFFCLDILL